MQDSGAMTILKNQEVPDSAVTQFFVEMKSRLLVDAIIQRRKPRKDKDFSRRAKKLNKLLKDLSATLSDPWVKGVYYDFSQTPLDDQSSVFHAAKRVREATNTSEFHESVRWAVDTLLKMKAETAVMFLSNSSGIHKAVRGDVNRAVVFAAVKAEQLMGGRYPSFLVPFFNTRTITEIYCHKPLTVEAVEKLLERAARKGSVRGLSSKPNPAKKT